MMLILCTEMCEDEVMMDANKDIKITASDSRPDAYVFGALDNSQSRYEAEIDAKTVTIYIDLRGQNIINTVDFVSTSVEKAMLTVLLDGELIERQV